MLDAPFERAVVRLADDNVYVPLVVVDERLPQRGEISGQRVFCSPSLSGKSTIAWPGLSAPPLPWTHTRAVLPAPHRRSNPLGIATSTKQLALSMTDIAAVCSVKKDKPVKCTLDEVASRSWPIQPISSRFRRSPTPSLRECRSPALSAKRLSRLRSTSTIRCQSTWLLLLPGFLG